MDNLEILATLGTQDKQYNKQHRPPPKKKHGVNQGAREE